MAGSQNSINRYPSGFLSLLDAKTNGQTPQSFEERLRTILDLTQFYLQANKVSEQGLTTAFATLGYHGAGAIPLLGPPQDEVWYLHNLDATSGGAALGAGVTIGGHVAIDWGNGTTPIKVGGAATFTPGLMPHWGGQDGAPLGIFVLPGWTLGFFATNVVVGGQALSVTAWVSKLKI